MDEIHATTFHIYSKAITNAKNNYFAFSGIGNNLKFFQTLEDANFNIVKRL